MQEERIRGDETRACKRAKEAHDVARMHAKGAIVSDVQWMLALRVIVGILLNYDEDITTGRLRNVMKRQDF